MSDGADDDLMRLAGCGDRTAFARLVGRHLSRAGAVAARITGNRSDAEEIVQEVFLRAWLKAPAWQAQGERAGGARFTTWFYRVLVNLCIDRRRRPVNAPLEAAGEVADHRPGGFEDLATAQTSRLVGSAVADLPERQRTALTLCHFEEMSNIEAAEILGVSVGALESLLVRARRTLREKLEILAPEGSRSPP